MENKLYTFPMPQQQGIQIRPLHNLWGNGSVVLKSYNDVNMLLSDLESDLKLWKKHERGSNNLNFSGSLQEIIQDLNGIFKSIQNRYESSNSSSFSYHFDNIVKDYFSISPNAYSFPFMTIQLAIPMLGIDKNRATTILAGYDLLKEDKNSFFNFLEIVVGNGSLSSQLSYSMNDPSKLRAVAAFFRIQVLDKSPKADKQVRDALDVLETTRQQTNDDLSTAVESFQKKTESLKNDFQDSTLETKKKVSEDIDTLEKGLSQFVQEKKASLDKLETTYEQKLSLEEPAKFWETQAQKYRRSFWVLTFVAVISALIILATGVYLLNDIHQYINSSQKIANIFPAYIIPLSFISLLVYVFKTIVNLDCIIKVTTQKM
ncbi:hypothetical protein HLG73_08130 [Lacticaseibacillus paracasei]|uniref:DUF6161 domain-containing protein n=1 Tax=Lacticaseibacillus paracasei TaxID=1597 RepID=UPI002358AA18|nr:DUF6161 domain-containing protein [Lacticaseibacillus paracasei]WCZ19318.1 hypothetical protein HLG73_08130 [Lacticaseibacillus paracasei]